MRDLEDEARIKAYMAAKMKHIKMYHECMNLADGLDVEKFAELVRADEREACAKLCDHWPYGRDDLWSLGQAIRARGEKPPVKSYAGGKPNYCTPVDAVPGFTVTEPRQSLSRMKPGDRFVLVRTGEICRIKNDGSQWNETAQRPSRFHKNSQVRLIVTHPKCDVACMQVCTEGFTKLPTCKPPVDAVNMSQDRVDETAKGEHIIDCTDEQLIEEVRRRGFVIRDAQIGREWVGLTDEERENWKALGLVGVEIVAAHLKEKNGG